jgi:hypothetical protein
MPNAARSSRSRRPRWWITLWGILFRGLRFDLGKGSQKVMGAGQATRALLPRVWIALDVKREQGRIC